MPRVTTPIKFEDYTKNGKLIAEELRSRQENIKNVWERYEGVYPRFLRPRRNFDPNISVNLVRKIIDQSVSLLFGQSPVISVPPQYRDYVKEFDKNFFVKLGLYGAISGHVFISVLRNQPFVEVVYPGNIVALWDDSGKIVGYSMVLPFMDKNMRIDFYQITDNLWHIVQIAEGSKSEVINFVEWSYPVAPVVSWQNLPSRQVYGLSDVTNYRLNDYINYILSDALLILHMHAHPRTIITGAMPPTITEEEVGSIFSFPNPEAKVYNLATTENLKDILDVASFIISYFYSEHRAVDLTSFRDKVGQLTNFGLRVLFMDALDKLQVKRVLYENGLKQIIIALIYFSTGNVISIGDVQISWPDPLPFNDMEEIEQIEKEMSLGILSKRTAALLRNRDFDTEITHILEESEFEKNIGSRLMALFEKE